MSNGKGDKWRGGWTPKYENNFKRIFGDKMSKDKNSQLSRDWNYEYGIFAKISGVSGSNWNEEQVKRYMYNNNISYKKSDKMKQLVERLKWNEDKKYTDM